MQENDERKEKTLCDLSRRLNVTKMKYSSIEKRCLALVFASQRLKHYFLTHIVHLVARTGLIKYVMSQPVLSGRLARWLILFNEFELVYAPRKVIKIQVIVNFLADHPIPPDWEILEDFPDEDVLFIDILAP